MENYRELCLSVPKDHEALRAAAHKFAREVMRPASIELDRMADPRDTIAPGSPLRTVLKKAYQLGYHVASLPAELGGLGLDPLANHILLEELGWGGVDLALAIGVASFPSAEAAASGDKELYELFVRPYVEDREVQTTASSADSESKLFDLEFEPHEAFDNLRKLARDALSVPKKRIQENITS